MNTASTYCPFSSTCNHLCNVRSDNILFCYFFSCSARNPESNHYCGECGKELELAYKKATQNELNLKTTLNDKDLIFVGMLNRKIVSSTICLQFRFSFDVFLYRCQYYPLLSLVAAVFASSSNAMVRVSRLLFCRHYVSLLCRMLC